MAMLGKILLVLLILVLVILFYIFFAPIRYRMDGRIEDEIFFQGKVLDPLRLIRVCFTYRDGESELSLRLLYGFLKTGKEEEDATDDEGEAQETEEKNQRKTSVKSKKKKMTKKPRAQSEEQEKKQTKHAILGCIRDHTLQDALPVLFSFVGKVLRVIKPKRFQMNFDYALGEPDFTGYATGVLSVIPVSYQKKVELRPDFDSEALYLRGSFAIGGGCCLIQWVLLGIGFFFKKEIQRLLDSYKGVKRKKE